MINKREEVLQAVAVGIGILSKGLLTVSAATRRAAIAFEALAENLEEQAEQDQKLPDEPGSASPGSSGPSGPTGPYPSSPTGMPEQRGPYDSPRGGPINP